MNNNPAEILKELTKTTQQKIRGFKLKEYLQKLPIFVYFTTIVLSSFSVFNFLTFNNLSFITVLQLDSNVLYKLQIYRMFTFIYIESSIITYLIQLFIITVLYKKVELEIGTIKLFATFFVHLFLCAFFASILVICNENFYIYGMNLSNYLILCMYFNNDQIINLGIVNQRIKQRFLPILYFVFNALINITSTINFITSLLSLVIGYLIINNKLDNILIPTNERCVIMQRLPIINKISVVFKSRMVKLDPVTMEPITNEIIAYNEQQYAAIPSNSESDRFPGEGVPLGSQ